MNAAQPLWQITLPKLEKRLQKMIYLAFILPLTPKELTDQKMVLETIDATMRDLIHSNYGRIIEETLMEICGQPLSVEIVSADSAEGVRIDSQPTMVREASEGEAGRSPQTAPAPDRVEIMASSGIAIDSSYNRLNPRYTFDRFVRGKSNEYTLAHALAVAESPARSYNPLFIYGDVGLGKTHLMHAIGHSLLERYPHYKVLYIPFENFLNEFITSIEHNTTEQFRNRYREVDLLLVDDIQFIVGKIQTQDEFFHTFNSLYNAQKQIVISSDRKPSEIQSLTDRIRSRFEAGLLADIQRPDLETRIAILQSKARDEHISIDPQVFSYIAARITSNIRELEGALMQLKARANVDKVSHIALDYAATVLAKIIDTGNQPITVELIQQIVASFYKVTVEDLKAKKRTQEVTVPRQIAMYFSRELTDLSLPKIGEAFGGRDHTTVMHAVDKVFDLRKIDPQLNHQLNELQRQIQI